MSDSPSPSTSLPVQAPPTPSEPTTSTRQRVVFLLGCAVAGVVAGALTGWVWALVADPPSGPLTADGVFFGELQLNQESEVSMWFVVVSVVAGAVAGLVVGWFGQRYGLVTVLGVLLLCVVATLVTYWTGVHVFGPDEGAQLADAELGDQVTSALSIGTPVLHLAWPIGGLAGALAGIVGWPNHKFSHETPAESSNVVPS